MCRRGERPAPWQARLANSIRRWNARQAFINHSCSGALWNFHVRFGPAITLR